MERCVDNDSTGHLLVAWIAKEELRALLACAGPSADREQIAPRLYRFYDWCARTGVPEVITLAETVETWWPHILAFLELGITNAATEGTNRHDQTGETRRLRIQEQEPLPQPRTVALHPAPPPGESEHRAVARSELKSP